MSLEFKSWRVGRLDAWKATSSKYTIVIMIAPDGLYDASVKPRASELMDGTRIDLGRFKTFEIAKAVCEGFVLR